MELDEDHSLRNNGKPLIFQGEFSNTLFKSSRLSKVNTIRSSSRSLVVRDFKNFQARELLFLMITLDMEIRELTFPTRVREGRFEGFGEGDDNRNGGGGGYLTN
jgi:hypothetical protein